MRSQPSSKSKLKVDGPKCRQMEGHANNHPSSCLRAPEAPQTGFGPGMAPTPQADASPRSADKPLRPSRWCRVATATLASLRDNNGLRGMRFRNGVPLLCVLRKDVVQLAAALLMHPTTSSALERQQTQRGCRPRRDRNSRATERSIDRRQRHPRTSKTHQQLRKPDVRRYGHHRPDPNGRTIKPHYL